MFSKQGLYDISLLEHSIVLFVMLLEDAATVSTNVLQELTDLVRLPRLIRLSLKDPMYRSCPVSHLCNYVTHVLFHLPDLQQLDTYDVTSVHLSELAYVRFSCDLIVGCLLLHMYDMLVSCLDVCPFYMNYSMLSCRFSF